MSGTTLLVAASSLMLFFNYNFRNKIHCVLYKTTNISPINCGIKLPIHGARDLSPSSISPPTSHHHHAPFSSPSCQHLAPPPPPTPPLILIGIRAPPPLPPPTPLPQPSLPLPHLVRPSFISFGSIVGNGIFFITGQQSRLVAGPAIVISNLISGISALLSSFAVDIPSAGGSFSYLHIVFGDFVAFIAAANDQFLMYKIYPWIWS